MKKLKCLICGEELYLKDELKACPTCGNVINYTLITKSNKIEVLKHDALIYITNREYNKLLLFIDNNQNNLLLEYYRMFSFLALQKQYDKTKFYSFTLNYSQEELDTIILHMIEHNYMFDIEDIKKTIEKSNCSTKYLNLLMTINNENEKVKEKDLREQLFTKTKVITAKEKDNFKANSITLIIFGGILHVLIYFFVGLFSRPEIQYSFITMLCILPSVMTAIGVARLLKVHDSVILIILMTIGCTYILSLPGLFFSNDYTILNHHIGVLKAPFEFFKTLMEGMKEYEK